MKFSIFIALLNVIFLSSFSQTRQENNNMLLLNERYIDRPLTLRKGELQIFANYIFSDLVEMYGNNGEELNLLKTGQSALQQMGNLDLGYEIWDFLQFDFSLKSSDITYKDITLIDFEKNIDFNTSYNYSGFHNPYCGLQIKMPLINRFLQFSFSGGYYFPFFNNNPSLPEYSFIDNTPKPGFEVFRDNSVLDRRYLYKNATNSSTFRTGTRIKLCNTNANNKVLKKMALNIGIAYEIPSGEGSSYEYKVKFNENKKTFINNKYDFIYKSNKKTEINLNIDYQLYSWLSVTGGINYLQQKGGYDYSFGQVMRIYNTRLTAINIMYYLKATKNVWFTQSLLLPLSGQNTSSVLYISTSLLYNFFIY